MNKMNKIKNLLIVIAFALPMSLFMFAIGIIWFLALIYWLCLAFVSFIVSDKIYDNWVNAENHFIPIWDWVLVHLIAWVMFVAVMALISKGYNNYYDKVWEKKMEEYYIMQHWTGEQSNPWGADMDNMIKEINKSLTE